MLSCLASAGMPGAPRPRPCDTRRPAHPAPPVRHKDRPLPPTIFPEGRLMTRCPASLPSHSGEPYGRAPCSGEPYGRAPRSGKPYTRFPRHAAAAAAPLARSYQAGWLVLVLRGWVGGFAARSRASASERNARPPFRRPPLTNILPSVRPAQGKSENGTSEGAHAERNTHAHARGP